MGRMGRREMTGTDALDSFRHNVAESGALCIAEESIL